MKKSFILATALVMGITTASYTAYAGQQPRNEVTPVQQVVEKGSIEERLEMLERAIVPTTAEGTIKLWATAVKDRNAALQYALFTKESRVGLKQSFEAFHWVSGASSPWVESFKVISEKENQDKSLTVVVEFELATSTGFAGVDRAKLTLVKIGGQWFIKDLGPSNEKAVGIWNTPESINEQNLENNAKDIKTFESKLGYNLQLQKRDMDKISAKDSTCKNEQGNPPCTNIYYKDAKTKKDVLIVTLIKLTDKQVKSSYYQDHPFLHKIGSNGKDTYFTIYPSEHAYAKNPNSAEAKEYTYLTGVLKDRTSKIMIKK
ncbi:hypothetical protein [Pseudoneobacillus sp. C159]